MAYWLLKTEPGSYAFADLQREGRTAWTGVANPVAQRHLRAMKKGDRAAIYHTGGEKAAVGVAEVAGEAYPDPSADGKLACIDLVPVKPLPAPAPLAALKAHPAFADSPLVRQGRLSVVPLTAEQWKAMELLAKG